MKAAPSPADQVRTAVEQWPEDWRDAWAERAAIIEFDAGESRDKAEFTAYWQCRRRKDAGGSP